MMTIDEKEQAAAAAFRSYLRGEGPPTVELATAPALDSWSVHVRSWPGDKHPRMLIAGEVFGHPTLADGKRIETSEVVWLDRSMEWCRTRTQVYRLEGKVIDMEGLRS